MPLVVLLLDADRARRRPLVTGLRAAGHAVVEADNPDDATSADVVVVAADLPGSVRTRVEAQLGGVPIVVAPGRVEPLLAELAALVRHGGPLLTLSAATVDLRRRLVVREGKAVHLTEKEAALLGWLAVNPLRTVSRADLLRNAWGSRGDMLTRTVDVTVRRLREKIEADPAHPDHIVTVHGEGYRFVAPSATPASVPPPPPAAPAPVSERSSPFVGRSAELAAIEGLFAGGARVVVLLGPPGVGKTRLARALAGPLDAVWCDLSEVETAEAALGVVAQGLGLPADRGDPERILPALAARGPLTLVIDGVDRVVGPVRAALNRCRAVAPEVRFLVTSRERLRVDDERIVDIGPLAAADATALFLELARARRHDYATRPEDLAAVDVLVRRLDGLPLALELAAARARVLAPGDLLARLSQRLDLLRDPSLGPRQATLRAALDGSWELLSDEERAGLVEITIFRAPFDLDAAEQVLRGPAIEVVEALVDRSLLRAVDAAGAPRFGLFESVRTYAIEKLDPAVGAALSGRHAAWVLARAEGLAAESDGADPWPALDALDLLRDEIAAAVAWALPREPDTAARMVLALGALHETRGCGERDRALLDACLAAEVSAPLRARLLVHRALARIQLGRMADADQDLDAADAVAPSPDAALVRGLARVRRSALDDGARALEAALAGPPRVRTLALRHLAAVRVRQGAVQEGRNLLVQGLAEARHAGLLRRVGPLLGGIAAVDLVQGQEPLALVHLQEALELQRGSGNRVDQAPLLGNLAIALYRMGRFAEAEGHLATIAAIHRDLGDRREEGRALLFLGTMHLQAGRSEDALPGIARALAIAEEVGDRALAAGAWGERGRALQNLGRLDESLAATSRAADHHEAVGTVAEAAISRGNRGTILQELGRLDEADAAYGAAIAAMSRVEQGLARAYFVARRAVIALERGQPAVAHKWLLGALDALGDAGRSRWEAGDVYAWLGVVEAALGREAEAEGALQAAWSRLDATRHPLLYAALQVHALHLEVLRGRAAFARAEAERIAAAAPPSAEIREACRLLDHALSAGPFTPR
jgi:predicted ATPase/DNA-binding winged helix-turn-helix (wHTH) protein